MKLDENDRWHLRKPFWRSNFIFNESLFFIRETPDILASAGLIFQPSDSIEIVSSSGKITYANEIDYTVHPRSSVVTLTPYSRIPFKDRTSLYPAIGREYCIAHKRDDNDTGLFFSEGHFFHDLQVEVSYSHNSKWPGHKPECRQHTLLKTKAKLEKRAALKICVCGDSISAGANASGVTGAPPAMPPFPELFAEELRTSFGGQVVIRNFAVGGKGIEHGLEVAGKLTEEKPDLVVVAYGMNDVGSKSANEFLSNTARIVERIRAIRPEIEFVLVSSMLGNPEWFCTPTEQFFRFRDALNSLCGERIIIADLTQLWADLLRYKSYHDLTGNGVNHPNDFGHRIYAQVLLDLISRS